MKKILVIDDDKSIRITFKQHLEELGHTVYLAKDGNEGLDKIGAKNPDLIISDIRMKGIDGLTLLEHAGSFYEGIPVIMITAFDDMKTTLEVMQKGAFDYLAKPIDLDELDLTIEKAIKIIDLNRRLKSHTEDASERYKMDNIVGTSKRMREIYKLIGLLTTNRASVLIQGESGTGKELIARAIHFNSPHKDEPFIALNCTALSETLLESELFGHVKGAFTGAIADKKGKFELAGRGTILLDEIGDTCPEFQAKLLRVLQEHEFFKVGGEIPVKTEARVIATTNRDLLSLVKNKKFREDLYYRLKVAEINVPPLRERREDIPILIHYLLDKISTSIHKLINKISPDVINALVGRTWPGNVRELENVLTQGMLSSKSGVLTLENIPPEKEIEIPDKISADEKPIWQVEKEHILRVLKKYDWNKSKAAKVLQISRPRLDRKISTYNLDKEM